MPLDGVGLSLGGRSYVLPPPPGAAPRRRCGCSARRLLRRLAASLGLPYVFAHHFAAAAPPTPWSCYRAGFPARRRDPAAHHPDGERGVAPRLRRRPTGWHWRPAPLDVPTPQRPDRLAQELVEAAEADPHARPQPARCASFCPRWFVGTPDGRHRGHARWPAGSASTRSWSPPSPARYRHRAGLVPDPRADAPIAGRGARLNPQW